MIDTIYDFIYNVFIGSTSSIPGAETLALLMTWFTITALFFVMVKLVMWSFNIVFKLRKFRS